MIILKLVSNTLACDATTISGLCDGDDDYVVVRDT
jgi:hypothetical protein